MRLERHSTSGKRYEPCSFCKVRLPQLGNKGAGRGQRSGRIVLPELIPSKVNRSLKDFLKRVKIRGTVHQKRIETCSQASHYVHPLTLVHKTHTRIRISIQAHKSSFSDTHLSDRNRYQPSHLLCLSGTFSAPLCLSFTQLHIDDGQK